MCQMQPAYSLRKETVTATMMLYENTQAIVYSLTDDTDFFYIVAGVLHRVTLATYIFNLPRLHITNGNRFNERTWPHH